MTLILSLANPRFTIQLSDRKISGLSSTQARMVLAGIPEESNKAGVIYAAGGSRLVYGFTGLAFTGSFDIRDWLKRALVKAGEQSCLPEDLAAAFEAIASQEFRDNASIRALSAADRRLSVMFTGYWNTNQGQLPAGWIITNFQRRFDMGTPHPDSPEACPTFHTWRWHKDPAQTATFTHIERLGDWPTVARHDMRALKRLLKNDRPVEAVIKEGVRSFRLASERSANKRVGRDISVVVVPSDINEPPRGITRSDKNPNQTFTPDIVYVVAPTQRTWLTLTIGEKLPSVEAPAPAPNSIPTDMTSLAEKPLD